MSVQAFIDRQNEDYSKFHLDFENNFWSTKMNLKGCSTDALTRARNVYEGFLNNKGALKQTREHIAGGQATEDQLKTLKIIEKTYECYMMENEEAARIKQETVKTEVELDTRRSAMKLGYTDPSTGEFKDASVSALLNLQATVKDEAVRKAVHAGLRSIGPFVVEDYCKIVKMRNAVARKNGYEDYYEFKLQTTEAMSKKRLFEILDGLEESTRPILEQLRKTLAAEKGEDALEPWNLSYHLSGDIKEECDPYFPFDTAVSAWARSFAALGVKYEQSVINLDLCDRAKKFSNGFCHWPVAPYTKSDGTFVPCVTNLTSLAVPSQVGSGHTALATLMHECGHAAHFANIKQASPFFSQERAPFSVAMAENQSMFLDSLVDDAAWQGRYAKAKDGTVMPWELIEKNIRQTHAHQVLDARWMIIVPYFEKAVHELPDEDITPENVLRIADEVERMGYGGPTPRPCLAVSHFLSDESACYYQGYELAEMAVQQTRGHFLRKYGTIVDNEKVGVDLAEAYWRHGNSRSFLDVVEALTGKPLTAADQVDNYKEDVEERVCAEQGRVHDDKNTQVKREKIAYEAAVKAGPKYTEKDDVLKLLDMRMLLVHGDLVVADTKDDTFAEACDKFKTWISETKFE